MSRDFEFREMRKSRRVCRGGASYPLAAMADLKSSWVKGSSPLAPEPIWRTL